MAKFNPMFNYVKDALHVPGTLLEWLVVLIGDHLHVV